MTSARTAKRQVDMGRLGEALRAPGIDASVWVAMGRVDDDQDAVRWEQDVGWVADVTFGGGPLDQVGPVPCRVASSYAAGGGLASAPVETGCEVFVGIPGGNPNVSPIILGRVSNQGCAPPGEVNGSTVDEAFALGTHFLRTTHSVQQQVGSEWRTDATEKAGLHAQAVTLAEDGASEQYVRGTTHIANLGTFLDNLALLQVGWSTFLGALAGLTGPLEPVATAAKTFQPAVTKLATDIQNFRQTLVSGQALSTRIKGE